MRERDIQDYLFMNPEVLFPGKNVQEKAREYLIHGKRIDLLFVVDDVRYIVEIKAVPIARDHIGQIVEYYGLMKEYLKEANLRMILVSPSIPEWRSVFLEEFEIAFRDIINRISKQFSTELTVDGEYFKRLFVYQEEIALKIEFIFENFKTVGQRKKIKGVHIDSKENIAANKITTIYTRKTAKDFFDLYFLLNELDFEQAAKWSEYKIVPLDYEGAVMAFADQELEGSVLIKIDISLSDFENFVENLIKKMLNYAKTIS